MQNYIKMEFLKQSLTLFRKAAKVSNWYNANISTIIANYQGVKGGVQGQKSWNHDFEITSDPKGPPSGSTFWWGFEAPNSYGYLWGRAPF